MPSLTTCNVPCVCPQCHGELQQGDQCTVCRACQATFGQTQNGFVDFAGPGISFDDWWMRDAQSQRRWLEVDAPKEELYEVGLAKNYVLPLLRKLGYQPGNSSVLSAGCGLGSDVDLLNEEGFATWGIDVGNRVLGWSERVHADKLARADLCKMPYPDNSFDFVLSLNTIEHIGVVGDTTQVTEDYLEQRMVALKSLLRVTKPGGHILLSGLSRTIPFDFGHIQEVKYVRIHSPWEKFLLNYNDIRRMCAATGDVEWARPLPLRGFFSWTRLRHVFYVRPFLPIVDWLFGCLPPRIYGSWISPFWIVLVRRLPPR